MNAVAEEVHKHRSTDGVTVVKTLIGVTGFLITLFIGLITYVYITDKADAKEDRSLIRDHVMNIDGHLGTMSEQQIVTYNHLQNVDAQVERNRIDIADSRKESLNFQKETRIYWGQTR